MLHPNKYLNLENCVLKHSSSILERLIELEFAPAEEVWNIVMALGEDDRTSEFHDALSLLYLLGLVDYLESDDVVVLSEPSMS